jgi:hypothetical protein
MGMDGRGTGWGQHVTGFFRRRRSAVAISAVALVAVLSVCEVRREDDVARRNQETAQLQSDQFASLYASTVARLLGTGTRTNAQLEPDAVASASGASSFYSMDGRTPGFSGSAVLLDREPVDSDSVVWLTIRIERSYPEAFGTHDTLETCYTVAVPTGKRSSAPVTTILMDCPSEPTLPYPSATA